MRAETSLRCSTCRVRVMQITQPCHLTAHYHTQTIKEAGWRCWACSLTGAPGRSETCSAELKRGQAEPTIPETSFWRTLMQFAGTGQERGFLAACSLRLQGLQAGFWAAAAWMLQSLQVGFLATGPALSVSSLQFSSELQVGC